MEGSAPARDVTMQDIAKAGFRATADTDRTSDLLKDLFGFGSHNIVPRLAMGLSLAIADPPPPAGGEPGREIRGLNLFGTGADLATWTSLFIEHAARQPADLTEFRGWVRAHWLRGMKILSGLMERAGNDPLELWRLIAETALPHGPAEGRGLPAEGAEEAAPSPRAIDLPLGHDVTTNEQIIWHMNAKGAAPHLAIMGASGRGKTVFAINLLRQIRQAVPVPLVAFDFKPDLTEHDKALDRMFDATVISPRSSPIPLDVLHLSDRSPNEITLASQKLLDSLVPLKGSGFGAVQKGLFLQAAERALRAHTPCTLENVRDALRNLYEEQGRKPDGALQTLEELCRLPLFEPRFSPAEFFSRSWIIVLPDALSERVRVSVVTLLTDALHRHLGSLGDAPTDEAGNRALRVLCVIDEAHRILETHTRGLANLLRLSRSRGGAVMLISQKPDDFNNADDDFLADMGLVVAFETNAQPGAVIRLFAKGANLAMLERGQAWVKVSGKPPRRIQIWR